MKSSSPISRFHLNIDKKAKVVEVGCGNDPHPRSNVLVDKDIDSNYHRSGDIRVLTNQLFIEADGEQLPFECKSFDYAICTHVLEQVDHPDVFLNELSRVAPQGYLEVPSLLGEYLVPKASHRWVILEIDNKIIMYEKSKVGFNKNNDFGDLFLEFMPRKSFGYKILQHTYINLLTIRYEWKNKIEVLVNPDQQYYKDYFTKKWSLEMCKKVFEEKSKLQELKETAWVFCDITWSLIKHQKLNISNWLKLKIQNLKPKYLTLKTLKN